MNDSFDQNMIRYNGEQDIRREILMTEIDGLTWRDNRYTIWRKLNKLDKKYHFCRQYSLVMAWCQLPKNQDIKENLRNRWISIANAERELRERGLDQASWNWFYRRNEAGEVANNG